MYRIEENVYAKDTGQYGKSLFALRDFKKDEIVFVAFGPIVQKPTIYTIPIDSRLFIDPTEPKGNLCQYICHSCEPNLGIKQRTFFVALRDIQKNEEVVVDYAMIVPSYRDEITEEQRICRCGRPNCRGKLGAYEDLPPELKRKYEGYISDYLLEDSK